MKLEIDCNIEEQNWNKYLDFTKFNDFIQNIFNITIAELGYVLNRKNVIIRPTIYTPYQLLTEESSIDELSKYKNKRLQLLFPTF